MAGERQSTPAEERESEQQVWREWGRLTRFMESARIAFARERAYLEALAPGQEAKAPTVIAGDYSVPLAGHLEAIADEEILYAGILIHSYALAEWAASQHLQVPAHRFDGIEDWGGRLLSANGRNWHDVKGGHAGAVEVAVIRNGFAHGDRTFDEKEIARMRAAGANGWSDGDRVVLTHAMLRRYRVRLRSLLNAGSIT
ncbi:MAG: hypothetical protein U0R51_01670 [Solirubrobacterales bacterium]